MLWPLSLFGDHWPVYSAILSQYLNELRSGFNGLCSTLEPWQIVAYTLSLTFLTIWIMRVIKHDKPLITRLKAWGFRKVCKLPWVRSKIEKELTKMRKDIEESIHKFDRRREFYKFLPEKGLTKDEILGEAELYQMMGEFKYFEGKVSGTVYTDDKQEHKEILKEIFNMYAYANPLHADVFPGCRKMEAEVVRIVCSLFHGGPRSCGTTSTGGTESIMLACMAYRNRAYKLGIRHPEMIVPITAHAAFDKAGDAFRIRVRHIVINHETGQVDVSAMKSAISSETCMLVGSAPNFMSGTMDPIEEIARLGQRYNIPVHVDSCLGGFLLPFMEQCDYNVKPFDFRLSAVTSISCDTHKYAFCPKGSSIIMYRDEELLHYQYFVTPEWPGGIYATPTFAGSRCGSNIALTWATLLYYGKHGYMEATQKIIETTREIRRQLELIDEIRCVGSSDTSVVAFASNRFNIYALGDRLNRIGWNLNTLQNPPMIHICVTMNQTREGVVEEFVEDVREAVSEFMRNPSLTKDSNTAAIYGIAAAIPDKALVEEIAHSYLDSCYATPAPIGGRESRTFSIEGRKLSMIGAIPQFINVNEEMRAMTRS